MSVDLPSDAPPSARAAPFIASAGDLVYLWGGKGDTEPEAVFLFHRDTKTWARQRTRGPHPPAGLNSGGCCISGHHLYIYGGGDGKSRYGTLYELNTNSWTWRKLSDGGARGPGKKLGCRMIPYQDQLLVVGGSYDGQPSSRQAGASYDRGCTNEIHCFNLITGLWSSPSVKGSRPPPCHNFSLTVTDEDQAVMFGVLTRSRRSCEAHILHLPTMTWTKHTEGDPWPGRRDDHIAACLGYGGQHKTLLISGGWGNGVYDDMWLLDLQSGRMEELQVPEKDKKLIQRQCHGAATLTVNSDCVEVILFGGFDKNYSLMADTTILRFVRQALVPDGVSPAQRWILTDPDEKLIIKTKRKLEASDDNALKKIKMQAPSVDTEVTRDNVGDSEEMMSANMQDTPSTASSDKKTDFKEVIPQQSGEMRQASAPEGVSPAQRWILTDPDEFNKKVDASTKSTSESFKATDLPASHDNPESTQDVEEGSVENDDKKSVSEEVLTEETESKLLKEYPQLTVARQNEELSYIPGFNGEQEIAITYRGRKGSVQWKEAGIQLFFEEMQELHLQEATKCLVQVSKNEGAYSELPSNAKPLSRFYHISSSKSLNTAVTLRIFHQAAEEDIRQLCFLTSTNNAPPYNYKLLYGGHFTSAYGEITVESFSLYTICQLYAYHGVKGILSYMERSYEARLYCSIQPTTLNSGYRWSIYLSVVKNCYIFTNTMKTYIQEEFEDKLKLVSKHVVIFDDAHDFITVQPNLSTNSPESVFLDEVDHESSLSKELIMHHVDGCPPLLVYRIHGRPSCSLDLKFTLEGLQKEKHFTLHQSDLPELCPKAPRRSPPKKSTLSRSQDLNCRSIMQLFHDEFSASNAKNLGTYLEISSAKLQELKKNNSCDAEGFLLDTINYWLENDTEKSWTKLAEAVKYCGYKLLAEKARSMESV